ncbi:hypothetical protein GCM10010211_20190 [Streptomyces albospinus]|uniref:Uncharacterized protein n=1 Tax=Streptomyces albospinus TaxID=285515 RepID=A0ABQ2UWG3_9ACTN|nr:hypothetical protein [Streptomyces albospinus]GGU55429.1 hypothetical protein GCM10010211_20190 [Streptomyces albospinus]
MSVVHKPTSQDEALVRAFGASLSELYAQATSPEASAALTRALELRSWLAVAEEQVARVRERIHDATAADRYMGELSADDLRFDAQWMEAALAARDGYATALTGLLRTMPPPAVRPERPVQLAGPKLTTTLPPAPAPARAGAARARRP